MNNIGLNLSSLNYYISKTKNRSKIIEEFSNVALEKTTAWRNRIAKGEWQSIVYNTQEKASNINEIISYGGTSE